MKTKSLVIHVSTSAPEVESPTVAALRNKALEYRKQAGVANKADDRIEAKRILMNEQVCMKAASAIEEAERNLAELERAYKAAENEYAKLLKEGQALLKK